MKSPNLLALSAAILITAGGLASMQHSVTRMPLAEINGIHVTDMPAVNVTPSAEDRRDAALSADVISASIALPGQSARAEPGVGLISSQMAMPYYSFGNTLGRINKD